MPTQETSGQLTVAVPFNAKVFINGKATTSTGSNRQFVSYGLKPGLAYKYEVRAEWIREGQLLEETKDVILTAGSREGVALNSTRRRRRKRTWPASRPWLFSVPRRATFQVVPELAG